MQGPCAEVWAELREQQGMVRTREEQERRGNSAPRSQPEGPGRGLSRQSLAIEERSHRLSCGLAWVSCAGVNTLTFLLSPELLEMSPFGWTQPETGIGETVIEFNLLAGEGKNGFGRG